MKNGEISYLMKEIYLLLFTLRDMYVVRMKKTRDLARKEKVLRCRHRHEVRGGGTFHGGVALFMRGGMSVGCGT